MERGDAPTTESRTALIEIVIFVVLIALVILLGAQVNSAAADTFDGDRATSLESHVRVSPGSDRLCYSACSLIRSRTR